MATVKEKIQKLLALADSPNENEAKLALLKARALMAQHKICDADLRDMKPKNVVYISSGITCTSMTDPWVANLGATIASHYCCKAVRSRVEGMKTNNICFVGLQDDVDVANNIFKYAYDCVMSRNKQEKRRMSRAGWSTTNARIACNSYGYGFVRGLEQAYKDQETEHQEWGLVMSVPTVVTDYMKTMNLKKKKFGQPVPMWAKEQHDAGYQNGRDFRPDKRIN